MRQSYGQRLTAEHQELDACLQDRHHPFTSFALIFNTMRALAINVWQVVSTLCSFPDARLAVPVARLAVSVVSGLPPGSLRVPRTHTGLAPRIGLPVHVPVPCAKKCASWQFQGVFHFRGSRKPPHPASRSRKPPETARSEADFPLFLPRDGFFLARAPRKVENPPKPPAAVAGSRGFILLE